MIRKFNLRKLFFEECAEGCVTHILLSVLILIFVILIYFRQRLGKEDTLVGMLLVDIEMGAQEVVDFLVEIKWECIVRYFVGISVFDSDNAVGHDVGANFFELINCNVFKVKKGKKANFFPHVCI